MARSLGSSTVFLCVTLFACLLTVWGLQFTLTAVAEAARTSPVKMAVRSSYVSTLSVTQPAALNAARTSKVVPRIPSGPAGKTAQTAMAGYTHTVGVESLRVRSGPKKTTPQLFALKGGTKVTVLREDNGWVEINADGRTGWVFNRFLRPAEPVQAQL